MQHANAPLTPNGRLRMVLLVEEQGLTFEAAAAASNVAKSTCWEWVRRWRAASGDERRSARLPRRPLLAPAPKPDPGAGRRGRADLRAARRTGWSPRRLADEPDIARPHSTVHRVLAARRLLEAAQASGPAVVRYEWPCPGNLLHMDTKKLGRFEAPATR